jgi:hypothetical protein
MLALNVLIVLMSVVRELCPAGTMVCYVKAGSKVGSSTSKECARYCKFGSQLSGACDKRCNQCPSGQFQNKPEQKQCNALPCAAGLYGELGGVSPSSTLCTSCPAGRSDRMCRIIVDN